MKVLVTGALGNVGKYVLRSLVNMGEHVVAADIDMLRLETAYGTINNVETVEFDFTDSDTFPPALAKVDCVFLMRPPHLGKAKDLEPFIQALAQADIKLVSFLSLMGVENNPVPPHHRIEKLIEKYELPYAHVRPSFFMQNVSGVHAQEVIEDDAIFIPAGKSKTSFIDAQDIGLAIATLLHSPERYRNTTHTITGPEALDYFQVSEILTEVLGRKISYAQPSLLSYRTHYLKQRRLNKGYVNVTVMLYIMTRLGTAKKVTADFEKLTGRKPRTFKEFAQDNRRAWEPICS